MVMQQVRAHFQYVVLYIAYEGSILCLWLISQDNFSIEMNIQS